MGIEPIVVDTVAFRVEVGALLDVLQIDPQTEFADDVRRLAAEAEAIARPKGVYKLAEVNGRNGADNTVLIDGVTFTSRVLCVNLEKVHRVFPFVATCGVELARWAEAQDDWMLRFWADSICEMALEQAIQALGDHLVAVYDPGLRATMNPGSLEDWPISQQRELFSLFGDVTRLIGVRLSESFLMWPIKSVSGLWFQTDTGFVNCQLCPRETCPNRRAPYNPHLMAERYAERCSGGHS